MKKAFLVLMIAATIISCKKNDDNVSISGTSIEGRWHLVGFEQTVMYEFTSELRYTINATDGNFGGVATANPNPNSWSYQGETLVIDLNFGNFLIATPIFRCNGNVVDLVAEQGTSTLFREGYAISNCNE